MSRLHRLDPHIIQQIAAGEVIERPVSVVRELVDNALDAGASRIRVHLRQGGQSFIRVDDDAIGLSQSDIRLAIERHTTSKIDQDLRQISTYGFRGEGLASIAFCARMVLSSFPKDQDHGWSLRVDQGQSIACVPFQMPLGTSVEVRDLFYGMPARLKFMRSASTEQALIMAFLEKMMLVQPDIHFEVLFENRKRDYPKGINERLALIFGKDFLAQSFSFAHEAQNYAFSGYVGLPGLHRGQPDQQLFFVNKRPVKDKLLSRCVKAAFQDVLPMGRHSVGAFFLTVPMEDVDVNVHPAKNEVRFRDTRFLNAFVLRTLEKEIQNHAQRSTLPKASLDHWILPNEKEPCPKTNGFNQSFFPIKQTLPKKMVLKENDFQETLFTPRPLYDLEPLPQKDPLVKSSSLQDSSIQENPHTQEKTLDLGVPLGQIQNRYILAQSPQGLVVVDPHAAHERILYEELKKQTFSQSYIPFLLEQNISLTRKNLEKLELYRKKFEALGLSYTINDEMCFVRSVPTVFKAYALEIFFEEILEALGTLSPEAVFRTLHHRLLAQEACEKSIRLGQSLSLKEMEGLLRHIEKTNHSAQCNHGRPTYKIFPLRYFDRLFERP